MLVPLLRRLPRPRLRLPEGDPFRDADIRLLFGAQGISSFGSQVSHIAFPLIAIDVIQASNGSIALLEGAFLLPFVLFSLPVGALLDRRARRPVLIAADLFRMAALLLVPLAAATGNLTMPLLLGVLFAIGAGTLVYDVAHQSYLPAILRGPRLAEANSRLMAMEAATGVAGPSIAGIAVGRLGGPLAVVVDSLSYLVSALLVRRVRHVEAPIDPAGDAGGRTARASLRTEIREGLSWVLGHRYLRGNALAALLFNFFGGIASGPVMIAYARRELLLPAELIGLILGAGVIGLVAGSASAAAISARFGMGRTLVAGGIVLTLAPLGIAILDVSMGPLLIALLAVLAQIVAFFGAALFHTNQVTYRQLITPKQLLGRMNASMKWVMLLGMPAGALLGALVAEHLGLRAALFAGALGTLIAPLPLLASGIARVERQPEHTEE
ncbi:MAG: hypothetical protein RLZZ432_729 [Chloroflexota bacterium]